MKPARFFVLQALLKVEEDAGYSNIVLDQTLSSHSLSPQDRRFAAALFYGVLERLLTLDAVLAPLSQKPLSKWDAPVRMACRMGAYQIYYMDSVPDAAAVNESVKLVRMAGKSRAAGFVNGVLRNLLRQKDSAPFPPAGKTALQTKAIRYSCPGWLIAFWEKAYGADVTGALLESLSCRPPVYVRVNTLRTTREALLQTLREQGMEAQPVSFLPNAIALQHTGAIAENRAFQQGLFHVQDLSSQLCCFFLGAKPHERIYDVCAAPGGKTFTIAQAMQGTGEVAAFDLYPGKVRLIQQGAQRLGLLNVHAAQRDAASPGEALPPADRVLCDAPCSGLGILRRKPEIRYKSKESIDSLPDLQYGILCKSASLVRPGGVLLYSTCTLNPAENGKNAARFLEEHPAFCALPLSLPQGVERVLDEPENQLTLFPQGQTDGFFISMFQRKD